MEAGGMEAGAGPGGTGLADAALLAPLTEDTFVHNLQVRFARDVIYTYVGAGVVCVNPCRALPLYSAELARAYCARPPHRLPPHVYAVAAAAHARVRDRREPQCIVVTGESGAGKTEAARLCLQCALLAAPTPARAPPALAAPLAAAGTLLEAFGNAATQRNHNASRFVSLPYLPTPSAASVASADTLSPRALSLRRASCWRWSSTSRATRCADTSHTERAHTPPRGERNFHVLYQLLAGADVPLLKRLKLQRSWQQYRILGSGEAGAGARAASHDTDHFAFTTAAMSALGLSAGECGAVLRALAFMLKLGNVRFEPHSNIDGSIGTRLLPLHELREACALVGVDAAALAEALTAPHPAAAAAAAAAGEDGADSESEGGEYGGDAEWARAALHRLLGALYSRLFTWLVRRAERALRGRAPPAHCPPPAALALLDLYGFEALADNGLERLLINYAAERLQAAVVTAARREQDEYAREGLPWRPLAARDADHAADLLDAGPDSVLAALRAAAARAEPDRDLVARLQRTPHPRLRAHPPDRFTVVHFAGAVTYSARGMSCKNRDVVCRACGAVLGGARDALLGELFAAERAEPPSPRRPQARSCRQRALVTALVRRLPAAPRLVRCLRADAALRPHRFDAALLRHQVRTQGIVETAALRRAGWCESMCARELLARYGVLGPRGSPAPEEPVRRARALLRALPIPGAEFAYGRTKVFIRSPRTVWELEALRAARVEALVAGVQRAWRRHRARRRRAAACTVWRAWSAWRARRGSTDARVAAARRLWRWWCLAARRRYLAGLWARLPARHRSPACAAWPPPPAPLLLARADALLRRVHHAWRCRAFRAAFDQTARNRMREKATASALFRGRKATYPASVAHPFVGDYVRLRASGAWRRGTGAAADRYVVFADAAGKVARASGRVARVLCVLSTAALLLLEARSLRVRRRVPAHLVRALSLSPHADDVLVVHVAPAAPRPPHQLQVPRADAADAPGCLFASEGARRRRGDVVLRTVHVLELATKLFLVVQNAVGAPPLVNIATEFEANFGSSVVTMAFHAMGAGEAGEGAGGARLVRRADRMDVLL